MRYFTRSPALVTCAAAVRLAFCLGSRDMHRGLPLLGTSKNLLRDRLTVWRAARALAALFDRLRLLCADRFASSPRATVCRSALLLFLLALSFLGLWQFMPHASDPIRVGVLYSQSGTMAVGEKPLIDAVTLAVEEINDAGGLLGRPIEIVLADARSDPEVSAREAERLISEQKINALFACWSSACRKAVKEVVERHDHLLIYAVQYEGLEQSPNILYLGAAPNQQIVPGAFWAMQHFGRRVYLLGSDYVFPRTAHRILRDLVLANGGEVLGERFLPLGSQAVADIVAEIERLRPDVLLNTVNGDSNAALFDALFDAGLQELPIVSFSVTEPEMIAWGGGRLRRHYGVWSYFHSLPDEINQHFIARWQARFGADRVISDPVAAVYLGVKLWAQAVSDAGSPRPEQVIPALGRQSMAGPLGIVTVDAATHHLWKPVRVGHVQPNGHFVQVFVSERPLRPAPWPFYRSREFWRQRVANEAPR